MFSIHMRTLEAPKLEISFFIISIVSVCEKLMAAKGFIVHKVLRCFSIGLLKVLFQTSPAVIQYPRDKVLKVKLSYISKIKQCVLD